MCNDIVSQTDSKLFPISEMFEAGDLETPEVSEAVSPPMTKKQAELYITKQVNGVLLYILLSWFLAFGKGKIFLSNYRERHWISIIVKCILEKAYLPNHYILIALSPLLM